VVNNAWDCTPVELTNGVAAAEGQDHGLNREGHREEVLWPRVRLFQVHSLGSRARRKVGSELDVDGKAARGDHKANCPVQEAHTDRASPFQNAGRCGPLAWQEESGIVDDSRVENTPVPIIWFRLRPMMVIHVTERPRGDLRSIGAPLTS
jgi:hypothetical protein